MGNIFIRTKDEKVLTLDPIKKRSAIKQALEIFKKIPRIVGEKITVSCLKQRGIEVSSINELFSKLYINEMTGAYNKDYLYTKISKEMQEADTNGIRVCAAYFDGDNVKYINDTYNHIICDKEIVFLVNTVTKKFSKDEENLNIACPSDNVRFIRVSGDEFMLITYDMDPQEVILKLIDIKQSINEDGLNRKRKMLETKKKTGKELVLCPPISFTSVVISREKGETVEEIITRMDGILNNAKLYDRGSIYFEQDQVFTNNVISNSRMSEMKDIIHSHRGKDNYFILCNFEYLDETKDRRGKISSHTLNSVKYIDSLIKDAFEKCTVIKRIDESKSILIFKDCSLDDFKELKELIKKIIGSDAELKDKVLFSIGGQENLEQYDYERVIQSAEVKLNVAKNTGKEVIVDRRMMV